MRALLLPLVLLAGCGQEKDDTGAPVDEDRDGYSLPDDCDDTDPAVHPEALEECDGLDNDCDGEIDGPEATGGQLWFADLDGDGYGDPLTSQRACTQPEDFVSNDSDCDDGSAIAFPGADEVCNEADDDCDGLTDEEDAVDPPTWYPDGDGDGWGNDDRSVQSCAPPSGFTGRPGDCDDRDAAVNPEATEICNARDDDCDGESDEAEALDAATWYADADGDTHGDPTTAVVACDRPQGHVADGDDCDDTDAQVHPGASERCDGIDNQCDGLVDDASAIDAATWYADADADGYGDDASAVVACDPPSGHVSDRRDCDDTDPDVNPAATEICDGVDNDCTSATSEDGIATLDGASNFPRIQTAIEAASSGSAILVCDGDYAEALEIDGDLTLRSLNGSGSTTIDAGRRGAAITVASGTVLIEGFLLTDGTGADDPYGTTDTVGGGVFIASTDPVTLQDCALEGNEADYGGALYLGARSDVSIVDTVIENNEATVSGGGLYGEGDTLALTRVEVTGGEAVAGGGLMLYETEATLEDCTIADNGAVYGGGAYLLSATLTGLTGVSFDGNLATEIGGGIIALDASVVSTVEVFGNEADFGGGVGLYAGEGSPTLDASTLEANGASISGGGLWIWGPGFTLDITDTIVDDNLARAGGGLFLEDGTAVLTTCTVTANVALDTGGGAYLYGPDAILQSAASAWGSASAGDDNDPDDVYLGDAALAYTSWGSAATFTCDSAACR